MAGRYRYPPGAAGDLNVERVDLGHAVRVGQGVVGGGLGHGVEALLCQPVQHAGIGAAVCGVGQGEPRAVGVLGPHKGPEIERFFLPGANAQALLHALVEGSGLLQLALRQRIAAVAEVLQSQLRAADEDQVNMLAQKGEQIGER